jgi:prevent-host-death family protein
VYQRKGTTMSDPQVSIGQVKRDISELVNRVAYAGERIVLTSRGKPKAALVSVEDYEWLARVRGAGMREWQQWLAENEQLSKEIFERRGGVPIDVDAIWRAARADLEDRDADSGG